MKQRTKGGLSLLGKNLTGNALQNLDRLSDKESEFLS